MKKRLLFKDQVKCIGCGHTTNGKFFTDSKSTENDKKTILDLRRGRDNTLEAVGYRKVPGGWKCNNCTGIKGIAGKW